MSTISSNTTITLNGKTTFKLGGDTYKWSNNFLMVMDAYAQPGSAAKSLTVKLSGSDWNSGTLRFSGNLKVGIADDASGGSRFITHLFLNATGGTTASFGITHLGAVAGSSAAEKLSFGKGGADAVFLQGGNDAVTTGTGSVGSVNLGDGNNTATTGAGYVGSIIAYGGSDRVTIGAGNVGTVHVGDGNNTVTVGKGSVDGIFSYGGNDTVTVTGTGHISAINLGSGNNIVKVTGAAEVSSIVTYGGNDVVTTASNAVDSIGLGSGNNTLRTGTGEVTAIYAYSGIDKITLGSGGAQVVFTGSNNDVVTFNPLSDRYDLVVANGGSGNDTASFSPFKTAIVASLSSNAQINTGKGYFQLASFENLTGGAAADILTGDAKNNVVIGSAGDDRMTGLLGADVLYGGSGGDTFIYKSVTESTVAASGRDSIRDFTPGDKIDLSAIDASTTATGDQAFTFVGTALFTGTAGEVRYETKGAETYVQGDTNGDGKMDFLLHLNGALTLQTGYFIL